MLDRGKYQVSLADVLDVMEQVLPRAEVEVPGLAGGIRYVTGCSVVRMLPAAARVDGRPEVIEDMPVRMPAFTGCESDFPHPDPVVLAQQCGPYLAIKSMGLELLPEFFGPPVEICSDEGSRKGEVAEKAVGAHGGVLSLVRCA